MLDLVTRTPAYAILAPSERHRACAQWASHRLRHEIAPLRRCCQSLP